MARKKEDQPQYVQLMRQLVEDVGHDADAWRILFDLASERSDSFQRALNDRAQEPTVEVAVRRIQKDYYDDVRRIGDDIKQQILNRDLTDEEEVREQITTEVDGSQRVIYTHEAMLGLISSDNAGVYLEEFGAEGAIEGGDIQWSRLMYAAMERDVYEYLGDIDELIREAEEAEEEDEST